MTTTFTWRVNGLVTSQNPAPNHVRVVRWEVIGDDDGVTVPMVNRTMIFPQPGAEFVPYEEITPELALSWVHATLGETGIARVEAMVQYFIDCKKNPSPDHAHANKPLPWETATDDPAV